MNSGANLLVRGDKSAAAATVVALSADFPHPLVTWIATADTDLPALDRGTIVLQDVERLSLAAQNTLLEWLDARPSEVRVITTATADLFELVAAGGFLDRLYYRLNTLIVDAVGATGQKKLALRVSAPDPRRV